MKKKTNSKALFALLLSFGLTVNNLTVFATEPDDTNTEGQTINPEGGQPEGGETPQNNEENFVVLQNGQNTTEFHYAEDITADKHDYELLVGEEDTLSYSLIGDDTSDESITWSLSGDDPTIISFNETTATIKGEKLGAVLVTATITNGKSITFYVRVVEQKNNWTGLLDTTAPTLNGITIEAVSVQAPGEIEVIADVTDDISGVSTVYVTFHNETYNRDVISMLSNTHWDDTEHIYVPNEDGKWHGKLKFDEYARPGEYLISSVSLRDKAQNDAYYSRNSSYGSLQLPEGTKDLAISVTESELDTTAPTLNGITIEAVSVQAPGEIEVIADVTDDISGVSTVYVTFHNETYNRDVISMLSNTHWDDTEHIYVPNEDGKWHGKLKFDQYARPGEYLISSVSLRDKAQNDAYYSRNSSYGSLQLPKFFRDLYIVVNNAGQSAAVNTKNSNELASQIANVSNNSIIAVDYSENATLNENVFDAIRNTGKTVTLEDGGVQWIFRGTDINKTSKDINLSVSISKMSDDEIAESNPGIANQKEVKNNPSIILTFHENGELPGKATIRIKADYTFREYLGVNGLTLYYYNNQTGALELVASDLRIKHDDYVEFDITHCSQYVLVGNNTAEDGFDIDVSQPNIVAIKLGSDFVEPESKNYGLDINNRNMNWGTGFYNVEVTNTGNGNWLLIPVNKFSAIEQMNNVDIYLRTKDSSWNDINKYYVGHLDTFGPYNYSDITGHAEMVSEVVGEVETKYLKLTFDSDFFQRQSEENDTINVNVSFKWNGGSDGGKYAGKFVSSKEAHILLTSISAEGTKLCAGKYNIEISDNGKAYRMGSVELPTIGADGTISVSSSNNGEKKTFSLTGVEGLGVGGNISLRLFLNDKNGHIHTISPYNNRIEENQDGSYSFLLNHSSIDNGNGYLPESNYFVDAEVNDGPNRYVFSSDDETVFIAKKGIERGEESSCAVDITGDKAFSISCTGLSSDELEMFRVGSAMLNFDNNRRIDHLISTPTWGNDNTSVTLTVTPGQLKVSNGQYIPVNSMPQQLEIHHNQDSLRYDLAVSSDRKTLGPIKTSIEDLTVTASEDGSYIEIKGDSTILNNLYTHTYNSAAAPAEDFNYQTKINLSPIDWSNQYYNFPTHEDRFPLVVWHDEDAKDYLIVPAKALRNYAVKEGDYNIEIECINGDENGYGRASFGGENGIHLKPIDAETIEGVTVTQNDDLSIVITVPEGQEDYLYNLYRLTMYDNKGNGNGTNPFYSEQSRDYAINKDGNPLTMFLDPMKIVPLYNVELEKAGNKLVLEANGYHNVEILMMNWKSPLATQTSNPAYEVNGNGIVMRTADKDFADATLITNGDSLRRYSELRIAKSLSGEEPVTILNGDPYQTPFSVSAEYQSIPVGNNEYGILIPVTYKNLVSRGITKFGKEDTYFFSHTVPGYRDLNKHGYTYSLAPIYAKYLMDQTIKAEGRSEEVTVGELETIDSATLQVDKDKLNNCTVKDSVSTDSGVNGLNIDIEGAVGGVVQNDLVTVFDEAPTITVEKQIGNCTTPFTTEDLVDIDELQNAVPTDVKFDITLSKTYNADPDSKVIVDELPYSAAITFDLPSGALEENKKYTLVSEHDEQVNTYDVTVQNGKGVAFVNKYSSFTLVKEDRNDAVSVPVITVADGVDSDVANALITAITTSPLVSSEEMSLSESSINSALEGLTASEGNKLVVQSYLSIQITGASDVSVSFSITPMIRVVEMPEDHTKISDAPDNTTITTKKDGIQNNTLIQSRHSIVMELPLPSGWALDTDTLYVTHEKNNESTYYYKGQKTVTGVKFTNKHGFSTFTVTKGSSSAKAEIGDTGYTSLQEAVDEIKDNETLVIVDSTQTAVVSREVSFYVNGDPDLIRAGNGYSKDFNNGLLTFSLFDQSQGQHFKYTPIGTKITWSIGNDITVTCNKNSPSSDVVPGCVAYLNDIKDLGASIMIVDRSSGGSRSKIINSANAVVDDSTGTLTVPKTAFDGDFDGWMEGATMVEIGFGNRKYPTINQGSEASSNPPFHSQCTIEPNEDLSEYTISCPSYDYLSTIAGHDSISLIGENGPDTGHGAAQFPNGYTSNLSYIPVDDHTIKITATALELAGYSILEGQYDVCLIINRDPRDRDGLNLFLTDNGKVQFKDANQGTIPSGLSITSNSTDKTVEITCNTTDTACTPFLKELYKTGDLKGQVNYGVRFSKPASRPYYFPDYPDTVNPFTPSPNKDNPTKLIIPADILTQKSIVNGTQVSNVFITVPGYMSQSMNQFTVYTSLEPGKTVTFTQSSEEPWELTVSSEDTTLLEKFNNITIRSSVNGARGSSVTEADKKYSADRKSVTISLAVLHPLYSAVGTGFVNCELSYIPSTGESGDGIAPRAANVEITHPFRKNPSGLQFWVVGDGIVIRDISNSDPEFAETVANKRSSNLLRTRLTGVGTTRDGAVVYGEMFDAVRKEIDTTGFEYELKSDSKGQYVLVHATLDQLINAGAKKDLYYKFGLYDTYYGDGSPLDAVHPLNAIVLADEAAKSKDHTTGDLSGLDQLAITTATSGLKNVTVKEAGTNGAGVDIIGEVAGAITTDNKGGADNSDLNYEDPNVQITVKTDTSAINETEANRVIKRFDATSKITATDIRFDVQISKQYNSVSGKEGTVNIKELPYEAAMIFNLPETPLAEGEFYHLLREHDGVVEEVTNFEIVTIDNVQKGVAYSDKFSEFVLVTGDEKITPKVVPAKKDTSSGSSAPKKDNVVTCQMAGYPASYSWNEAAKACQPGYLDDNGVFHLTSGNMNKRVGVVNTSDRGLGGNIAGLICSTLAAIAAAYALRKWN